MLDKSLFDDKILTMKKNRGFTLIVLVIVMLLSSILIFSTTSFVSQSFRLNVTNLQKHQALMAAQAGAMKAAYETLENSTYTSSEATLNSRQKYKYAYLNFSGGGGGGLASDYVYIDPSATYLASSNREVRGLNIINTSTTNSYTITHILTTWSPSSSRSLDRIRINNSNVWTGTASSGTTVDISDTTIPAGTTRDDRLRFSSNMSGRTITTTLIFSDGSTVSDQVYPPNSATLPGGGGGGVATPTTIKSTGSLEAMRQTIISSFEVSGSTLKFTNYDEVYQHL